MVLVAVVWLDGASRGRPAISPEEQLEHTGPARPRRHPPPPVALVKASSYRLLVSVVATAMLVALVSVAVARSVTSTAEGVPPARDAPQPGPTATTSAGGATPASAVTSTSITAETAEPVVDLVGAEPTGEAACVLDRRSIGAGDTGPAVDCLQQALIAKGRRAQPPNGVFDGDTQLAVEAWQTDEQLFVDGVVGRETALSLGIWPDESSSVIRTPPPEEGAVDLMGYPLSSVASSGSDAPPLPPGSGSGRRLVYDRAGQRVWAVDQNETVIRSWLISGSKYDNELPGTHDVYSRSDMSTAWNGQAWLPKMVRWLKTDIGAIGFHALPLHVEDDSPYQTEAELGTRLSGGCQRQANADADFTWDFAQIGTTVVVV